MNRFLVVNCQNVKFHANQNPLNAHRIRVDWFDSPKIIRCDKCGASYWYDPQEIFEKSGMCGRTVCHGQAKHRHQHFQRQGQVRSKSMLFVVFAKSPSKPRRDTHETSFGIAINGNGWEANCELKWATTERRGASELIDHCNLEIGRRRAFIRCP
jgi:hypothetical protein